MGCYEIVSEMKFSNTLHSLMEKNSIKCLIMISDISIGDSNVLLRIIISLLLFYLHKCQITFRLRTSKIKFGRCKIKSFFKNFAINLNAYHKNT